MHCKQSYDEELEECNVCGHEEFKLVGEQEPEPTITLVDDDYDGPTISNVREAGVNPEKTGNRILVVLIVLILLLAVFILLKP